MEHVPVRVNGPIGGESILAQGYDHILMIAGGVAVSTHYHMFCLVPLLLVCTSTSSSLCPPLSQTPSSNHTCPMVLCAPS